MNIKAVGLTQRTSLANGTVGDVQTFLSLELPNGKVIEVQAAEESAKELLLALRAAGGAAPPPPQRTVEARRAPPPPPPQPAPEPLTYDKEEDGFVFGGGGAEMPEPAPEGPMVRWSELPDEMLHPLMKAALAQVGTPALLSGSHLQVRVENIQNTFTEEDWNQLDALLNGMNDKVEAEVAEITQTPTPAQQADQEYRDALELMQPDAPKKPKRKPAPALGAVQWANGAPIIAQSKPARTVPKDDYGNPMVPGQVSLDNFVGSEDVDDLGVGQA